MNNLIYLKIFLVIGSISSIMIIFYYLFNIYIYINYSNNKIKTLIYLPQFMINWVSLIKRMSKYEDKKVFIQFYIKLKKAERKKQLAKFTGNINLMRIKLY